MYAAQECRLKAENYARLAESARAIVDRDRFLRMKRSYELMARGADFGSALAETVQQLKR